MDLRAYRLGFAPTLVVLVLLAFSLQGAPEPLEPAPGTVEFDSEQALADARTILRRSPARPPGSAGAATAADFVRSQFEAIVTGTVAEQRFEASVDGEDVELRNVLLTMPGSSDRTTVIVAARDSRTGTGAATSAAATGVLLEIATKLGVSGRQRSLIFASVDGATAGPEGVRELLEALPERTMVDAVLVIFQPGAADLRQPHLVTSSTGTQRPSLELVRTAEQALLDRAELESELDGPFGQIARLALPAAAGLQAALLADGVNAVAISAAGEASLPSGEAGEDELSAESMARIGAGVLALAGAIEARIEALEPGPATYVRAGENVIPEWVIELLVLALLIPPGLMVALALLRSRRSSGSLKPAFAWGREWPLAALAPLVALYALAFVGLLPSPDAPYDPGRFAIGPMEVIALVLLGGVAVAAWWALRLRRGPARREPAVLAAGSGAAVVAATLIAWLANPFLALFMVPLAHVAAVHGAGARRTAALAIPVALLAALPFALALAHVAAALDWGASAPWQLVVLVAGGGLGFVSAAALLAALGATIGVVRAALTPGAGTSERN